MDDNLNDQQNQEQNDQQQNEQQQSQQQNEQQNYQQYYQQYVQQGQPNNQQNRQQNGQTPSNGKAIASLVLGIVALVCVFFGYTSLLGIILAIVGVVLGTAAKNEQPSGMATAGIVLSIIALGICAVAFLACIACAGALAAL